MTTPAREWQCDCGAHCVRYPEEPSDTQCDCGQWWNAYGQRVRFPINPDSELAPSGFDPLDAGESWNEPE